MEIDKPPKESWDFLHLSQPWIQPTGWEGWRWHLKGLERGDLNSAQEGIRVLQEGIRVCANGEFWAHFSLRAHRR